MLGNKKPTSVGEGGQVTDEIRLSILEMLAELATPEPWVIPEDDPTTICHYDDDGKCHEVAGRLAPDDADFIICAREDVPLLIAMVHQLEKEADWLAEHRFSCCCDVLKIKHCKHFTYGEPPRDAYAHKDCVKCWRKAAREAVKNG